MKSLADTRKLTTMGIIAALSVALVFFIHFPIIPQAPFLEYDPADIPILILTFIYGPLSGLIVTLVAAVVQGLTVSAQSGAYGVIMHIISTGSFVISAGLIYRIKQNRRGAGLALICGLIVNVAVMVPANLIVTPVFMGASADAVKAMLLPAIIPFNLVQSGINGAFTYFLYELIFNVIKRR